jgi:hypothetical protein
MPSEDNGPAKLTEEMRAEINPESIDDMVKLLEPADIVSPETVQTEYEETESTTEPEESDYIETVGTREVAPKQEKITEPKERNPCCVKHFLHSNSESVRKNDTTIIDIQRKIKDLQIIMDLQHNK